MRSFARVRSVAALFRDYATLCRVYAETEVGKFFAADLLRQAERWEQDADRAEEDAKRIAESRELIEKVAALQDSEGPRLGKSPLTERK